MYQSKIHVLFCICITFATICWCSEGIQANFQVVHILDPNDNRTTRYGRWNSDQWISWIREKYQSGAADLKGSWVNIVITAPPEDMKYAYSHDSMPAYTDPQRSDYFWSDYAFPVYVVIRSPNATVNTTAEKGASEENDVESSSRTIYGFNVYSCLEKKMFINAKIDPETEEPVHFQTFFPKRVKNPKDKLRIPLSVCNKISQTRNLVDEIMLRFNLS